MKKESVLRDKSFEMGLEIIQICKILREKKTFASFNNQLIRSGTAVGALVREAEFAQSRADFINKMSVALKEANETEYWLKLLLQSGEIGQELYQPCQSLINEVISILVATIKTARRNVSKA